MKILSIIFYIIYVYSGFLVGTLLVLGYVFMSLFPIERTLDAFLGFVTIGAFLGSSYLLAASFRILKALLGSKSIGSSNHLVVARLYWFSVGLAFLLGILGTRTYSGLGLHSVLLHVLFQLPLPISLGMAVRSRRSRSAAITEG